jgi:hypothetical protein
MINLCDHYDHLLLWFHALAAKNISLRKKASFQNRSGSPSVLPLLKKVAS